MLLAQVDPHHPHGAVRTGREQRVGLLVADVPEQLGVVVKLGVGREAVDLPAADGKRIALAARGHVELRRKQTLRVEHAQHLVRLVDDDPRRLGLHRIDVEVGQRAPPFGLDVGGIGARLGNCVRHLDRHAGREASVGAVEFDQHLRRRVEHLRQLFERAAIAHRPELRLRLRIARPGADERPCQHLRRQPHDPRRADRAVRVQRLQRPRVGLAGDRDLARDLKCLQRRGQPLTLAPVERAGRKAELIEDRLNMQDVAAQCGSGGGGRLRRSVLRLHRHRATRRDRNRREQSCNTFTHMHSPSRYSGITRQNRRGFINSGCAADRPSRQDAPPDLRAPHPRSRRGSPRSRYRCDVRSR